MSDKDAGDNLEKHAQESMSKAVDLIHGAYGFKSDYVRTRAQELNEVLQAIEYLNAAAALLSLLAQEEARANAQ